MRLKTQARRARHRKLRGQCEPKRTAHIAKLICKRNRQLQVLVSLEKRGRRKRKDEVRHRLIDARKQASQQKPVKPEFAT